MTSAKEKVVKILIADDHEVVRRGIHAVLQKEPDMEVVGEAGNGLDAVQQVQALRPDLVLMDISMPLMDGIRASKKIKEVTPKVKILVLTLQENRMNIPELVRSEIICGVVYKNSFVTEIPLAIRAVMQGKTYFSPEIMDGAWQAPESEDLWSHRHLTQREKEILKLIAEGKKNKQVSEKLFISVRTVEKHRQNIIQKLNLQSAQQLTLYALSTGLISGKVGPVPPDSREDH